MIHRFLKISTFIIFVYFLIVSTSQTRWLFAQELPTVSVQTADGTAAEAGPDNGQFKISRSATAGDLTVSYRLAGTAVNGEDYQLLTGSAVIPSGASTAVVSVAVIDDALSEGKETVKIILNSSPEYIVGQSSAGLYIYDDEVPIVNIIATDKTANEKIQNLEDYGVFSISAWPTSAIKGSSITVYYVIKGLAKNGEDYYAIPPSLLIPQHIGTVTLPIAAIDDNLIEGKETVTLMLTSSPLYQIGPSSSATVTIYDND